MLISNLVFNFQFVILVVDSTDRERLTITKDELNKMLDCDVSVKMFRSSTTVYSVNINILSQSNKNHYFSTGHIYLTGDV